MFRAIYENFTNGQLPPNAQDYLQYQNTQQNTFRGLVNPIIVQDSRIKPLLENTDGLFNTSEPVSKGSASRDIDLANNTISTDIPPYLKDKHEVCIKSDLPSLVDTYNPLDKVRCGWIYEKGSMGNPPKVSVGGLGTRTGPLTFFKNPPGKWFWDLDEALKLSEKDNCMNMRRCEDMNNEKYSGKCAFDKNRGYGVPITTTGNIKYADDPFVGGSGANLIRSIAQCPKPPASGSSQDIVRRSIDVCAPRADGSYSRDCMLQQITTAGCKKDGGLYTALINQASPNNYGAGLEKNSAFQQYQNRSKAPLLQGIVKDGRVALDVALSNIKELSVRASKEERSAIHYSARDLCLEKDAFQKFDFCWDLTPTSQPPFRLDCLQREFLKAGGQSSGELYPTEQNKAQWDSVSNWGEIQSRILKLAMKVKNTSETGELQDDAMKQLIGITREKAPNMIERILGADIYWFDRDRGGVFMGRRISQNGLVAPFFSTNGNVENTGKSDMVEFCMVTNLRPNTTQDVKFVIEIDDGARIFLNRDFINGQSDSSTRGQDTGDMMDRFWAQAPTRYTQKNCWKIVGGAANYLTAWWQEDYGQAHWLMYFQQCSPNSPLSHISPNIYSLTQEPDTPMLSFMIPEKQTQIREYRLPGGFPILTNPGTRSVSLAKYPIIKKYSMGTKLVNNGLIKINKQIYMNAFRTLNIGFVIDQLPGFNSEAVLCQFGNLHIDLVTKDGKTMIRTTYKNSSGSVKVNVMSLDANNSLQVGKPYIYTLKMESIDTDMLPTKMVIQLANMADAARFNFPQSGHSNVFISSNNAPIYIRTDNAILHIGDPSGNLSANITLIFCDLYDYEMNTAQYQRAAVNDWMRSWIS